jgi:NAD(P)-dependent dehydrogenase (short-subunit alcohol dehydrogenase family)
MTNLRGKVALITGSTRSIGKTSAERFGRLGASVVVHYSKGEEHAKETVAEIERLGRTGIAIQTDVSQTADIDRLFSTALERALVGTFYAPLAARWTVSSSASNSRPTCVIRSSPNCPKSEDGRSYSKIALPDSSS